MSMSLSWSFASWSSTVISVLLDVVKDMAGDGEVAREFIREELVVSVTKRVIGGMLCALDSLFSRLKSRSKSCLPTIGGPFVPGDCETIATELDTPILVDFIGMQYPSTKGDGLLWGITAARCAGVSSGDGRNEIESPLFDS